MYTIDQNKLEELVNMLDKKLRERYPSEYVKVQAGMTAFNTCDVMLEVEGKHDVYTIFENGGLVSFARHLFR